MKKGKRIVELLEKMLVKFDVLIDEVKDVRKELKGFKFEAIEGDKRLGKVENETVKFNLASARNSRLLKTLTDNSDRIARLEKAVFK